VGQGTAPAIDGGVRVVALRGEIDLATADGIGVAVRTALSDPGCRRVQVDLADVEFLDCAGVRALLDARGQAERRGVRFGVVHARGGVRKILMLTGVYGTLREH